VLEDRHLLAVFTVTTAADSGPGSLRQAILDSDASPGQANAIRFAVAGSGAQTIAPLSPLPAVTTPTDIDGTSQPGFAGSPLIVLNGANAGAGAFGLVVTAGGSSVRGLAINGFGTGVYLTGGGGDFLDLDYVGTDAAGAAAVPNTYGVLVGGSSNNIIGRSVLSGNSAYGVLVLQGSANRIGSDFIGTNAAGSAALANGFAGVGLVNGAANNLVYADLLSGNSAFGAILDGSATVGNQVYANYVGLSLKGAALGNGSAGVMVESGAFGNTVGGAGAGAGNVVSGNGGVGVFLYNGAHDNVVEGNRIGTDIGGGAALANTTDGVQLAYAGSNLLLGNVLSGNGRVGVLIGGAGATGNILAANFIGTDAAGSAAVPNAMDGVYVFAGASGNRIGGSAAGSGNVISGNAQGGLALEDSQVTGTLIAGNWIGTNAAGTAAIANGSAAPNGGFGVHLLGMMNTVGGTAAGAGNVISGNAGTGLDVVGSGNLIQGNRIGTNAAGTAALPNTGTGVDLSDRNTLGGTTAGAGNLISGNGGDGVDIASLDLVEGNLIGTNADGTAAIANKFDGVGILRFTVDHSTIGGTAAGAGNLISGNARNGIHITGTGVIGASGDFLIEGNRIGTNAAGTAAVPNGGDGVFDQNGENDTIGGTAAGAGNLISGNAGYGVHGGAFIEGNKIGTNAAGTAAIPNGQAGVFDGGQIGGAAAGAGNLISGNFSYGVLEVGVAGGLIQGNLIGTAADGATALPNGNDGVFITSFHDPTETVTAAFNTVSGNVIAFNKGDGVLIGSDANFGDPAGTHNQVTQNSIFGNTQIGIDLGPDDGVTPNDSQGHSGPNNFQDFPIITAAVGSGAGTGITTVSYSLTVTANVTYTVEFFVSPTADPSGFGQGKTFVGSATVSSSTGGTFPEQAVLTGNFAGQFVTATATDADGNTSEFSNAVQVSSGATPG
jgi:titin